MPNVVACLYGLGTEVIATEPNLVLVYETPAMTNEALYTIIDTSNGNSVSHNESVGTEVIATEPNLALVFSTYMTTDSNASGIYSSSSTVTTSNSSSTPVQVWHMS